MRRWLWMAAACSFVFLGAGNGPVTEQLELTQAAGGVLVATLHTAGDAVVSFNYHKDSCYFSPDHGVPCYTFTAVNGTEPVPISGCVSNQDAHLGVDGQVGCPVAGVKQVRVVLASGGSAVLYRGNGTHNDCSPAAVSVEAHGDVYHVMAWDGCVETVTCGGGLGQIDADKDDEVQCGGGFVSRH
jgi:hypothetical protein